MTEQQPPKIEFPCRYPIKVVGDAAPDFKGFVMEVMHRHAPGFDETSVRVVDSRNGRFQSVRITIEATGEEQLAALFRDLKSSGRVQMVL